MKCSAKTGSGIRDVAENINKMLNDRVNNFKEKEIGLLEIELKDMVLNILEDKILSMLEHNPSFHNFIDKIQNKKVDPYQAADDLTSGLLSNIINQSKKYQKSLGVES